MVPAYTFSPIPDAHRRTMPSAMNHTVYGLPPIHEGSKDRGGDDVLEETDSTPKDGGPRAAGGNIRPVEDVLVMPNGGPRSGSVLGGRRPDDGYGSRKFIVDSGASIHATGDPHLFSFLHAMPPAATSVLRVANGSTLPIRGRGTVRHGEVTLRGVVFVPGLTKNIVSVSRLGDLDYTVEFTRTGCFIRDAVTGDLVGQGHLVDGLFELDFLQAPLA